MDYLHPEQMAQAMLEQLTEHIDKLYPRGCELGANEREEFQQATHPSHTH